VICSTTLSLQTGAGCVSIAEELEPLRDVGLHFAALDHRVQEAMRQQKFAALDSDFTYLPLKQAVAPDTMKAAW
jgi:hypothetical protein